MNEIAQKHVRMESIAVSILLVNSIHILKIDNLCN